jgi:MFS family permease
VSPTPNQRNDRYARYVLGVLLLVYVCNFLDRQIISILAERIRTDLGVSDAQLGFLYGTAFAVFFALFGIPLGHLADVWDRRRLIAIGLALWSAMTASSGLARNFRELATARIGVGIGEASATPAAHSLLSDYFPPSRRATVLAMYASGIYLGAGLGLGLGGLVVQRWDAAWVGTTPPFGLHGWQIAFFIAGFPGLLLSLWVRTLREPERGRNEGITTTTVHPHPFRAFGRELGAVVPPFTLLSLVIGGASGRQITGNLLAATAVAALAATVIRWIGDPAQWIALGIGCYAAVSWAQSLARRDPPTFALVTGTPSLRFAAIGFALLAFVGYGIGFWTPPFFMRVHHLPPAQAGLILGGTAASGGWLGTTLGGVLADRWRQTNPAGRLWVGTCCGLVTLPFAVAMLTTTNTTLALCFAFPTTLASSLWLGPSASTVQDLVLPRMRGSAAAAFLLVVTFIGLALGPYTIGRLSVALGDLRTALLGALVAGVVGAGLLFLGGRHIARDEASRLARARAAGEPA